MPWFPDGEAIRAARERRGLSLAALAERAGLTVAALHRLEIGRTHTIRPATLDALGKALQRDKDDLARWARTSSPTSRARPKPVPGPTLLTARVLANVRTAYRAHEGRLFRARGRVAPAHGELSRLDRIALGCSRTGVGGRFVLMLGVGKRAQRVSVYSIAARGTLDLEQLESSGAVATLDLRLRVVETPADHPTISARNRDEAGDSHYFARNWPRGFVRPEARAPVPWAFVVEAIDGRRVYPVPSPPE